MTDDEPLCPFCFVEQCNGITRNGILMFGMSHGATVGHGAIHTVCSTHHPTALAALREMPCIKETLS